VTASKPVIGLVGCGRWGCRLAADLVRLGCPPVVVARSEDSRRRALEAGARELVPSVESMPAVDGVVVATPTATHAAVIDELLPLGVPIFVEKPMTPSAQDAARLAAAAPDRLFVMDKWRYHPGVELLADLARSGELGPVLGLRTSRVDWGNPHRDVDAVWILAPHELAIALEVLGEIPQPTAARAERLDGSAAGLTAMLGDDPWVIFEVGDRWSDRRREIRLFCAEGVALLVDGWVDHVRVYRGVGGPDEALPEPELRPISTELPTARELRTFVEHLQGGPPPRSSAAEGALVVETIARLRALAGLES
jgi:predicted dehydrogenase